MQPLKLVNDQPRVRVYFIATSLVTPKPDGTYSSPLIAVDGHGVMQMPPIGEYLEVAKNVAEILIRQTNTTSRDGKTLVPGMTYDAKYAELIAEAFNKDLPLQQVVADHASDNLTDEQLLAIIAKRNLQAKAAEAVAPEESEESTPRKAGRPKKEV